MKFYRHATPTGLRATAGAPALKTAEVSRHDVRLVVIDRARGDVAVRPFRELPALLGAGDLVVVNDAATLPASLAGRTLDGRFFELRLAAPIDAGRIHGVLLGEGNHRTRTEHRPPPPALAIGDHVRIGTIDSEVTAIAGRRVELATRVSADELWQALYTSGRPVQYAHRPELLPLWSVQTAYAGRPWAAEMPSAGRPLTWDVLLELKRRGVGIASLTHAAGLSSTGDDELDRALPWPERYEIPRRTSEAIATANRVIAIGTTVVRALEASLGEPGSGVATLRIDARYRPVVVDGLVSGLHVPGESHFDLLSAFAPRDLLARAVEVAAAQGLSGHELGDACLIL